MLIGGLTGGIGLSGEEIRLSGVGGLELGSHGVGIGFLEKEGLGGACGLFGFDKTGLGSRFLEGSAGVCLAILVA